jgi:hypothetical protein
MLKYVRIWVFLTCGKRTGLIRTKSKHPNTHIPDRSLPCPGTGTSIKGDEVKLVI